MDTSGQAADQMVKYSIEGAEFTLKVAGAGAERLAAIMAALIRDQQRTKGKTNMRALLKSGRELTVFTIPDERLREFAEEAKRYGVLYCVIREKQPRPAALSDILVKAEDAAKINRIVERLGLAQVDILKDAPEVVELTEDQQALRASEELMARFAEEPEAGKAGKTANPQNAQTEILRPYGRSSGLSKAEHESMWMDAEKPDTLSGPGPVPSPGKAIPRDPEQRPSVRAALAQLRQQEAEAAILEQELLDMDQKLKKLMEEQR